MYNKLNITENHLQVLSLFTDGFDREYYIREVERLLKISPRTAQLILEDLENRGIIESKKRGKIKGYCLRKNNPNQRYLVLTEQYKAITFLEQNLLMKELIDKMERFVLGIGIIFGSYAKGRADKKSDLDIFVAGNYDTQEIRKISQIYGVEISVKCYPLKTFKKAIRHDVLIREVLKNHIVFLNSEQFVAEVLKNG